MWIHFQLIASMGFLGFQQHNIFDEMIMLFGSSFEHELYHAHVLIICVVRRTVFFFFLFHFHFQINKSSWSVMKASERNHKQIHTMHCTQTLTQHSLFDFSPCIRRKSMMFTFQFHMKEFQFLLLFYCTFKLFTHTPKLTLYAV